MKEVVFLSVASLAMSLQNVFKRGFTKDCPLFFSFCTAVFALLVFVATSGFDLSFDAGLLKYAIAMGLFYAVCTVTLTLAFKIGRLSLSGLIVSASLIIPTLYGIIFQKNSVSVFFVIGMCVLAGALLLVNLGGAEKSEPQQEKRGVSIKWLIFILVASITNGVCSILQTAQQTAYSGSKKSEFMIIVLAVAGVCILIASLITEKGKIKEGVRQSLLLGGGSGIMNGLLNLFVMLSLEVTTASVIFPVISGVSLLITFVIATLFFKEKYSKTQYIGYAVGLVSVVLLNL